MILKKYFCLLFSPIIFYILFDVSLSIGLAEQNKSNPTCEVTIIKIDCFNLKFNQVLKINLFNEPYRILIEFEEKLNIKKHQINDSKYITSVRFNKFSQSNTKLAIEFKKPTIISDIKYSKIDNKSINLRMYFSDTSPVNYAIAKHVLSKNNGDILSLGKDNNFFKNVNNQSAKIDLSENKNQNFKKIKLEKNYIVFIDPGHGGKDPGAIGKLGTLEKDVTLKVSILLAKLLRKNKKIIPILSRNKDIYLSLKKRTTLAKKSKADIFISIHADSSKNKKAKGISVFSLSDKASDREAQILAQRENEVDDIFGKNEKIKDPLIYGTLIKMFQREAMNDSSFLAKNILSNLEQTKLAVNRGHRFAGFSVLKSYDIPSVLIEIGFLSNKIEEKKLLNSKYLNELSKGLAIAIQNYFKNN